MMTTSDLKINTLEIEQIVTKFKGLSEEHQRMLLTRFDMIVLNGQRRHPRDTCKVKVDIDHPLGSYREMMQNISHGGAYIETCQEIEKGDGVALSFIDPATRKETKIKGEVVRSDMLGIGVKFIGDTPEMAFFKGWLAAQNKHLASHMDVPADQGGYCYTRPNGYNYANKMAVPVTIQKAFSMAWVQFDQRTKKFTGHPDWAGLRYE